MTEPGTHEVETLDRPQVVCKVARQIGCSSISIGDRRVEGGGLTRAGKATLRTVSAQNCPPVIPSSSSKSIGCGAGCRKRAHL